MEKPRRPGSGGGVYWFDAETGGFVAFGAVPRGCRTPQG